MKRKDKIKGGKADKKQVSDFDRDALREGTKHEMEHTDDRSIAQEIAMDHLTEDPQYYKKLKAVEKQDRIEITADGKRELDVGAEPLDKLKSKWKHLKKALNSDLAIMSLENQEYDPERDAEETQQEKPEQQETSKDQSEDTDESSLDEENSSAEEQPQMSEDEVIQVLKDEGYSDTEIAHIIHGHILPEATVDDHKAKNEALSGEMERQHAANDGKLDLEHKKRMNDLEYEKTKSEIADPETEKSHRKRMLDLEYETESGKKAQSDLETQHRKRMLDLEYENAKREAEKQDPAEAIKAKQLEFELAMKRMEKELELEFKKKELELKLKLTEEAARQKADHQKKQAEEDAKINSALKKEQAKHKMADAKKPPQKEKVK